MEMIHSWPEMFAAGLRNEWTNTILILNSREAIEAAVTGKRYSDVDIYSGMTSMTEFHVKNNTTPSPDEMFQ